MSEDTPKPTKKQRQPIAVEKERWSDTFKHHLFKLLSATCKRNRSFSLYKPKIQEQDHGHIYHSVSRKGAAQKYCSPMAGHFHEIQCEWDGDKLMGVKCGPPMRYKWRSDRMGKKKRVLEKVIYKGEDPDGSLDVIDDHRHELKYEGSEEISARPQQIHNPQGMLATHLHNKYSADVLAKAQQTIKAQ